MDYKLGYDVETGKVGVIIRLSDNSFVPLNEDNPNFRAFLKWNSEQPAPLDLNSTQYLIDGVIVSRAVFEARRALIVADAIQKTADITVNLPTWAQVETAVNNIANLADAKVFLKKLARVVYWLAKNTSAGE